MTAYNTVTYAISSKMNSLIDQMNDTSVWPRTEYTISDKGLNVRTTVPGTSDLYKSYDIPKYVFTTAIKEFLPELIQTDPDIRNMISNVIKKEIRKAR